MYGIESDPEIVSLGQVAIFYLPKAKLTPEVRDRIKHWLIHEFRGVTISESLFHGYYLHETEIVKDQHLRYEVSFEGTDRIPGFLGTLKTLCRDLDENSVYVTMGKRSFLIQPKKC